MKKIDPLGGYMRLRIPELKVYYKRRLGEGKNKMSTT